MIGNKLKFKKAKSVTLPAADKNQLDPFGLSMKEEKLKQANKDLLDEPLDKNSSSSEEKKDKIDMPKV